MATPPAATSRKPLRSPRIFGQPIHRPRIYGHTYPVSTGASRKQTNKRLLPRSNEVVGYAPANFRAACFDQTGYARREHTYCVDTPAGLACIHCGEIEG